jgi:gluconolactonase
MFAVPKIIETKLVARLPEKFHVAGRISGRYDDRKFYLEGPTIARDGTLYFTDVPWGRIFRLTADNQIELYFSYDGEPNGMKIHKDGRMFIADNANGIMVLDPQTKKIEPYVVRVANERLIGPNDLTFASNGDLYFTDQGSSDIQTPNGRIIRIRADKSAEILLTGIPSPNGLVLSPDEKTLYIAVTKSNTLWKVPLEVQAGAASTHRVGRSGVWVYLSGGVGPDGMAVDDDGNVVVAHTGFGAAWVFTKLGEPLYRVQSCAGLSIANLVYGGPDRRTLYIIESSTGSVLSAQMPTPGRIMYAHM